MRSVKTLIVIVSILVIGAICYNLLLGSAAKQLSTQIEQIKQTALEDNWESTNQKLAEFDTQFKKTGAWLSTLVHHHDVDSIYTSLERLIQYGNYEEKADFMAELSNLTLLIEHIPAKEKLTIANFL